MVANGMIVFLYRQFFQDVPDSLIESAVIDGAGTLRIFFQLLVPLSKPVIISASLMMFIQQWDAFLWPLVAATKKSLKVIQVAISEFNGEFTIQWGTIFAATTVAIAIPDRDSSAASEILYSRYFFLRAEGIKYERAVSTFGYCMHEAILVWFVCPGSLKE
jgi:ABC-type sugar transport system, permease component